MKGGSDLWPAERRSRQLCHQGFRQDFRQGYRSSEPPTDAVPRCIAIMQGKRGFCWFASVVSLLHHNRPFLATLGATMRTFVDTAIANFKAEGYDGACPRLPVTLRMNTVDEDGNQPVELMRNIVETRHAVKQVAFGSSTWKALRKRDDAVVLVTREQRKVSRVEPLPQYHEGHHVLGAIVMLHRERYVHSVALVWCGGGWKVCDSSADECWDVDTHETVMRFYLSPKRPRTGEAYTFDRILTTFVVCARRMLE